MTDPTPDLVRPPAPAGAAPGSGALERFLKPHPVVLAVIWLFVASHFLSSWATVGNLFNDTDDAMRLVEVRDFLAGQGWFDLHQYRLDPPADLPMHWSRFIDLPIAVLIRLAEFVVSPALAEKFAMYVWPLLVLIPALVAVRRIACRLGGDWAALPALYLTATCAPVVSQFVPGRIDHHNVQITLTLWLLAFLLDPPSRGRGVKLALTTVAMMAVGMETIPFILIAALAVAVRFVTSPENRDEAIAYGGALAIGTLASMAGTMPPKLWSAAGCDALSANFASLAVVGGVGLVAIGGWAPKSVALRVGALAVIGALALAAYALPDPACLRGPFGQIVPEVRAVWLDTVLEVQPWKTFFAAHHVEGLVALIVPGLAALSALLLAGDPATRRSQPFWWIVLAMAIATAIGLLQIRTIIYADILSIPLIAAAIGRLAAQSEARGRAATVTVLVGTMLASASLITVVIAKLAPASWTADEVVQTDAPGPTGGNDATAASGPIGANVGSPCMTLSNYKALAQLPPGLVGAEINIGPSILAATPHSVVTAPYHRMQRGILDGDHMMRRKPDEALKVMDARRVDYVAVCTASNSAAAAVATEPDSLFAALIQGRAPARLEEIGGGGVIRVWRLTPATAFAGGPSLALTGH